METQHEEVGKKLDTKESLEKMELTSPNGISSIDVYKKLLMLYLIENELPNAKFLWKRIPQDLKSDNELCVIWKVGQFLWKREFPNVHETIRKQEWSADVSDLVGQLKVNLRNRLTELVLAAYSIIRFDDLRQLLGICDDETVIQFALEKSWTVDTEDRLVKLPLKDEKRGPDFDCGSEELLYKLTNYVSFLEN